MAVTQLNQTTPGSTDFTLLVAAVDKNAKGMAEITITNYDGTGAPDVKVGSVFENNGSTFIVDTSDITPTGYAGISNSTTFYLYYDETGTTFIYSATVPTWSDALQGWYNGNDRAFFSMYKDSGGTLYETKSYVSQKEIYDTRTDDIRERTNGSGISLESSLLPLASSTEGSFALTTAKTTVPRGIYLFEGNTTAWLEVYINSTWKTFHQKGSASPFSIDGGMVFSDGTNVRISVNSGSNTVYYRKF